VSDLFRHIALVVAMTAALAPVAALADSLADQATISKVQASWGPGETAMSAGHYAKAVAEFQSTISYLQSIHDVLVRKCVAEGAKLVQTLCPTARGVLSRQGQTTLDGPSAVRGPAPSCLL
jgi:hypothetical protein